MGLGSTISRSVSVAGSSKYEPSSSASSTASMSRPVQHPAVTTRAPRASILRASTVTSETSMSKLIRSSSTASTSRESTPVTNPSLRSLTVASRTSSASTDRASTVTCATSTSNFIQSDSTSSIVRPPTSAPAVSTTSLFRSGSKRAPSYFSTAASRFLWGRPPPGHSTLQPSHVASLTHILSLPNDTPMLSSLVGALGVPISRSQFSPTPSRFCDVHFWLEQKYIAELTEVIAHEIGPQLDKLRIAPTELISKKTNRLLATLQPYRELFFTAITDSSSITSSIIPTCPACTLSHFFQNPAAVTALTTCVKGRKHRNRPWPGSMAWLEPCPGKGVDWEAKWKAEGKSIARDRIRVQRWRRETRLQEQMVPEQPAQVPGHGPGEGCDFCDALRLEQADEEDLDAVIAEEEEKEEEGERAVDIADGDETVVDDDDAITLHGSDDSRTLRAMQEESIIKEYLPSSSSSSSSSTASSSFNNNMDSLYHCPHPYPPHPHPRPHETRKNTSNETQSHYSSSSSLYEYRDAGERMGARDQDEEEEDERRKKRASDWARSYRGLVGRGGPDVETLVRFRGGGEVVGAVGVGAGGWI